MQGSSTTDVARCYGSARAEVRSGDFIEEYAAKIDLVQGQPTKDTASSPMLTSVVEMTVYAMTPLEQAPMLSIQLKLKRKI